MILLKNLVVEAITIIGWIWMKIRMLVMVLIQRILGDLGENRDDDWATITIV